MSAPLDVLAVMGRAAGLLDCVTPSRNLVAAQELLDAAAAVAELVQASRRATRQAGRTGHFVGDSRDLQALSEALAKFGGAP